MPTVAEQLRHAREKQKLTVHQVAEHTKIRSDHIRALEEGNYNVFSAPVYIRGFSRSYATMLKLDVPQLIGDLDAELAQTKKFKEHPRLMGNSRGVLDFVMLQLSKINWRIALPILIIALVGAGAAFGLRAWQARQIKDPLRDLGPGIYQPNRSQSGDVLPLATNPPARTAK
jgi:cytoskeletal protein RodZ